MATVEELQTRLESLKKALASGAQSLTYSDGKSVRFRDVAELKAAISTIEQEIAAASGTNIVRQFRFTSDKDL